MSIKEEALKLADKLLRDNTQLTVDSAYMIRKLVAELKEKDDAIDDIVKALLERN
jgi:hypothetical protein